MMRAWKLRHVAVLWLAWSGLLLIGYRLLSGMFASFNFSLPLPVGTSGGGHGLSPQGAVAIAVVVALVALYLPPILATLYWLAVRRRPAS